MASSPASATQERKMSSDTLNLLRRVVSTVHKELSNDADLLELSLDERAFKYTGLLPKTIQRLKESDTMEDIKVFEVDRRAVYEAISNHYIEMHEMPTTYQLFVAMQDKLPVYMDIKDFRKMLIKMGYQWKLVTNKVKHFVIAERPEIVFERYRYLNTVVMSRAKGIPVYYIGESYLDGKGNFGMEAIDVDEDHKKIIYVVSKDGVEFITFIDNFDKTHFAKWVTDVLLVGLTLKSVIVFSNSKHHNEKQLETPHILSTDVEIIKWLDYHAIEYNKDVSRLALYDIAKSKTDLQANIYTVDAILKANGHVAVRTPDCINKMTPVEVVYEAVASNLKRILQRDCKSFDFSDVENKFYGIIQAINEDYVVKFCNFIADEQYKMIKMEAQIDNISDRTFVNLISTTDKNYYLDSDVPSDTE